MKQIKHTILELCQLKLKTCAYLPQGKVSPLGSFTLRNNANVSPSLLIQTLLRENQKLKSEYHNYKKESLARLSEKDQLILKLKEDVETNRKKMLEMKLQREVYVARETHAFQEIHNDISQLLEKVSMFANAESLKTQTSPGEFSIIFCYNDLLEKLSSLESRILFLEGSSEGVASSCKIIEENLKLYANKTNGKLDQIIDAIMGNRRSASTTAPEISEDSNSSSNNSLYSASCEDNQEDSDAMAPSELLDLNKNLEKLPIDISIKSSPSSKTVNYQQQRASRKRKIMCNSRNMQKHPRHRQQCYENTLKNEYQNQYESEEDCSDEEDKPPVLSLPCRIAKQAWSRPESMPILLPEEDFRQVSQQPIKVEPVSVPKREGRKDDALIGIKKENLCAEIHGKDFSKPGFVCVCGAKFTGAGGLYVHQVKAMENEKFFCRLCGKKFHYFSGLKAHRKSAHKQDFTQEVGCSRLILFFKRINKCARAFKKILSNFNFRCGQIFKSKKERQGHLDIR